MKEAGIVKDCLNLYEKTSKQLVNFDKSSILFSSNTVAEVQEVIFDILRVKKCVNHEKYLGA